MTTLVELVNSSSLPYVVLYYPSQNVAVIRDRLLAALGPDTVAFNYTTATPATKVILATVGLTANRLRLLQGSPVLAISPSGTTVLNVNPVAVKLSQGQTDIYNAERVERTGKSPLPLKLRQLGNFAAPAGTLVDWASIANYGAKFVPLIQMIAASTERHFIYTYFKTGGLDILERLFTQLNISFIRIDGSDSARQRTLKVASANLDRGQGLVKVVMTNVNIGDVGIKQVHNIHFLEGFDRSAWDLVMGIQFQDSNFGGIPTTVTATLWNALLADDSKSEDYNYLEDFFPQYQRQVEFFAQTYAEAPKIAL